MFNVFSNPEKSKPRILIVDNDPAARTSYQTLMMFWDYEPFLATGTGVKLLENAKKQAHDNRCKLALIDLRLIDDYDEQDISGLELAEEMSDVIHPIILSGSENFSFLRTLLKKDKDIAFISKSDNRDLIKEALDTEAAKVTAAKRRLVFENYDLLEDIANSPLGKSIKEYPDQIADAFARLFPNAKKLKLEKLELRPASSNISTVPRPNSVVLKVYEEDFEPFLVKLARVKKIQDEVDRYNKYVFRRHTYGFTARLERSSTLWDIGGISYSYIGSFDVKTFSRFYEEKSITEIAECLKGFFEVTWWRHYEQAWEIQTISLFKLYSEVWGNWYGKVLTAFPNSMEFDSIHNGRGLPDPVEWLKTKVAENPNDLSRVDQTRLAITHGDLHGDNLLVDSKKIAWVIDFERCGEGHALQDFIELEADIINRLEAHNENLSAYLEMCFIVFGQKNIQGLEDSETTSEDPRIEKALQTISILRSLALKCTKITDAREYLFGLLFNMLFRAAMLQRTNLLKSRHTLLVASLICHRLDHWNESWPSTELRLK
jgi:CheY-like chemotaxis protein